MVLRFPFSKLYPDNCNPDGFPKNPYRVECEIDVAYGPERRDIGVLRAEGIIGGQGHKASLRIRFTAGRIPPQLRIDDGPSDEDSHQE